MEATPNIRKKCFTGMTSHQWKELVSTHILKYTLHGLLGKKQGETLFFFSDTLSTASPEKDNITQFSQFIRIIVRRVTIKY